MRLGKGKNAEVIKCKRHFWLIKLSVRLDSRSEILLLDRIYLLILVLFVGYIIRDKKIKPIYHQPLILKIELMFYYYTFNKLHL